MDGLNGVASYHLDWTTLLQIFTQPRSSGVALRNFAHAPSNYFPCLLIPPFSQAVLTSARLISLVGGGWESICSGQSMGRGIIKHLHLILHGKVTLSPTGVNVFRLFHSLTWDLFSIRHLFTWRDIVPELGQWHDLGQLGPLPPPSLNLYASTNWLLCRLLPHY